MSAAVDRPAAAVPRVSVVIPTFNGGARLARAIDSVLAQDIGVDAIEIVVVDDGSTDGSRDVLNAIAARHPGRVAAMAQANAGPSAARNRGMRAARGATIAFLDDDDTWTTDKLRLQLAKLDADPGIGLVYCDALFVDDDGRALAGYPRSIAMHRGDVREALFLDFFLLTSAVLMRRACMEACGVFDESLPVGEDYEYFLRVSERFGIDAVDRPLLRRTVRPGSLSRLDYALDATIDLRTLADFAARNADLLPPRSALVRTRIGGYRQALGLRQIAERRVGAGLRHWAAGFAMAPSLRGLRALAGAVVRALHGARTARAA